MSLGFYQLKNIFFNVKCVKLFKLSDFYLFTFDGI